MKRKSNKKTNKKTKFDYN